MSDRPEPDWSDYERAVASFAKAMDPNAVVRHNIRLPDRDTQRPRQRDVWIESRVCNVFPVKTLVSCKKWKRKLHSGDVDAFLGELHSSGAHLGVLYSERGFTKPAIEKGKKRGVHCCRLYSNEPAELPESLRFDSYCCNSSVQLSLSGPPPDSVKTWGQLFALKPKGPGGSTSVLDALVDRFHAREREMVHARDEHGFPADWTASVEISLGPSQRPLRLTARGHWKIYEAPIQAQLANGTYILTGDEFHGSQSMPWIDRLSAHPGPDWNLLDERPGKVGDNVIVAILYGADTRQALVEHYAMQSFEADA